MCFFGWLVCPSRVVGALCVTVLVGQLKSALLIFKLVKANFMLNKLFVAVTQLFGQFRAKVAFEYLL